MTKFLIAASALALLLGGCAGVPEQQSEATPAAESAKPAISAEAAAALAAAQNDVKTAKARNALWTTAEAALKTAEEAAEKGDSETVLKQSKRASDHVKKGLAQLDYPMLRVGD